MLEVLSRCGPWKKWHLSLLVSNVVQVSDVSVVYQINDRTLNDWLCVVSTRLKIRDKHEHFTLYRLKWFGESEECGRDKGHYRESSFRRFPTHHHAAHHPAERGPIWFSSTMRFSSFIVDLRELKFKNRIENSPRGPYKYITLDYRVLTWPLLVGIFGITTQVSKLKRNEKQR